MQQNMPRASLEQRFAWPELNAAPFLLVFKPPSWDAGGAGLAGFLARSGAGPPTSSPAPPSTKRHLRCVSRYLPPREVPHSHQGSPGRQGKGSRGSIGGSRTSNTLQKYLREALFSTHIPPAK